MISLTSSIHLRPTGADATYRRVDYVRGFLMSLLVAGALLALSFWSSSGTSSNRLRDGIFFMTAMLALVGATIALIFAVHAVLGSTQPVAFAVAPDFVPLRLRAPLRSIMLTEWDPKRAEAADRDPRMYDAYLLVFYQLGRARADAEQIAYIIEEIEIGDSLKPGSDPVGRMRTAHRLIALFS